MDEMRMYFDYVNNFLTVAAFAAHYKLTEREALELIARQRQITYGPDFF